MTSMAITKLLSELHAVRKQKFSDWKKIRLSIPPEAGIYAVWLGKTLLYVSFAGTGKKHRGLRERLSQHVRGKRGLDKFSVLAFDRFVLPRLSRNQIKAAAAGEFSLDDRTAQFTRRHLSFTWLKVNVKSAMAMENLIREGAWRSGKPLLNPLIPEAEEEE